MKFVKKTDLIVICAILLIGLGLLWYYSSVTSDNVSAEIYFDGKHVKTVELNLSEEQSFSISEVPEVVFTVYPDKTVAFTLSDCPDKICVNTGKIGNPGQIAACVPNRVYVRIVGSDGSSPDLVIKNNHGK